MKPILFNTEMVRAILDGRKTQTRRLCKITVNGGEKVDHATCASVEYPARNYKGQCAIFLNANGHYKGAAQALIQPGNVLWVRETWCSLPVSPGGNMRIPERYYYRADPELRPEVWRGNWRPSIHMPKEAARLFLRVTGVRCERLQDITVDEIRAEGLDVLRKTMNTSFRMWRELWDCTVRKDALKRWGWAANPWVWVIEFERCEKP